MRRYALIGVCAIALVASGAFAASVIGDHGAKSDVGTVTPSKQLDLVRTDAAGAGAQAASAARIAARTRKVRIQFYVADDPVALPGNEPNEVNVTGILTGKCPGKRRILSGFYKTDRLIVPDNANVSGKKTFAFSFVNLSSNPGVVTPGIVCIKGAK